MGNRQNCARFQENLLPSNEIISILLPSTFSQTAYTPYLELYQSHQILILQILSITCIQNLNIKLVFLTVQVNHNEPGATDTNVK